MVPALGYDDFLLDESQKLLALRQGQAEIRDLAKITGSPSRRHFHLDHQSQSPLDPPHS